MGQQLAGRELEMAQDRFKAGTANNVEVVTAQDELARAEENYILAVSSHVDAKFALARALGNTEKNIEVFREASERAFPLPRGRVSDSEVRCNETTIPVLILRGGRWGRDLLLSAAYEGLPRRTSSLCQETSRPTKALLASKWGSHLSCRWLRVNRCSRATCWRDWRTPTTGRRYASTSERAVREDPRAHAGRHAKAGSAARRTRL